MKKTAVLHTDIGTDFDDNWALTMMLLQKEWDLKLVLVDTGRVRYRAAAAAKILMACSRCDVEIGLAPEDDKVYDYNLNDTVREEDLKLFPGKVSENGIDRLIEIVRSSPETVSLISIGPCGAIAQALEKAPEIAGKIDFTGMFGSIALAHEGAPGPIAEYNVVCNIPAAQKVFSAPWHEARLTPLDSCGQIRIRGEEFQKLLHSDLPYLKLLMEQYRCWHKVIFDRPFEDRSSVLFDAVTVHLASSTRFLDMHRLELIVDDAGFTREAPGGMPFDTATGFLDMPGFEKYLTGLLLGETE